MASEWFVNEFGEMVEVEIKNKVVPKTRGAVETEEPEKPKRKAQSDMEVARTCVEAWGRPLAAIYSEVYEFVDTRGWLQCTGAIQRFLNQARGRFADSAMKCLCEDVRLNRHASTYPYWERKGGAWGGHWVPLMVPPSCLVFLDAIVDYRGGGIEETRGRTIFGPMITVPWREESPKCQEFMGIVEAMFPDASERTYLQTLCSLILAPHAQFRGQIVLHGPGSTRKTTFLTAIGVAPGGVEGVACVQESYLVKSRWHASHLANKFANLSDDSPADKTGEWSDWLKAYTSGKFLIEDKFSKPLTVPTTAKLLSACNRYQVLEDASNASAKRVRVFECRHPIPDAQADPEFMTLGFWGNAERRAGVVAWLEEGFQRYVEGGCRLPEIPQTLAQAQEEALNAGDEIRGILTSRLSLDPSSFVTSSDLLRLFPLDVERKTRGMEMTLSRYMRTLFPAAKKTRREVHKKDVRGWEGVRINPE